MKRFFLVFSFFILIFCGIFVIRFFPIFPQNNVANINWQAIIPINPHCKNIKNCVDTGDILANELFGNHDTAYWYNALDTIKEFDSSVAQSNSEEENSDENEEENSENETISETNEEENSETENTSEENEETIFDFEEENFVPPAEGDDSHIKKRIAYYTISGNNISLKIAKNFHESDRHKAEEIWQKFQSIIPYQWRKNLYSYQIFSSSDGMGAFIGSSENTSQNPIETFFHEQSYNILGVNLDAFGEDDIYDTLTFLHEFAHLFSLSNEQNGNFISCHIPGIFECSYPNSYLQNFYNIFWKDFPKEFQDYSDKTEDENRDFFEAFEHQFINLYASGNPNEDFAESFTAFLIRPYHTLDKSLIIDQKQLFFYQYPELVILRLQILENLKKLKNSPL